MKLTEDDFDDISEKEDQSNLALIIIGVMCVIGLVIGIYFRPGVEPTMTIEMPEPPAIQKNENIIADTVFAIDTLLNDSIAPNPIHKEH